MEDFEKRFRTNLESAKQNRKIRLKQTFFNIRMYYLLPVIMSMTVANFLAHSLFNGKQQPIEWMVAAFGTTFVLLPFAFRLFRKNRDFDMERFYMLDAMQKTLENDEPHFGS